MNPVELLSTALTGTDRVAVTGASGWFGTTALDLLFQAWGQGASSRVVGYARTERDIVLPSGQETRVRALSDLLADPAPTVLLHFACLTRDRASELGVAEYVRRNLAISALVLAAVREHRPRLVVATSSGAVYGPGRELTHDLAANPYGTLKVLDELAFSRASEDVGAGWCIPRVFSVAGPGMTKPEKYALGSMIAMARAGGPIEIQASRPVFRSYCEVDEVIALALWTAARQGRGIFDTAGHLVEMADLASAVARSAGGRCIVTRPEFDPSAPPDHYVGDATAFNSLTHASGLTLASLDDLVASTVGAPRGL